MTTQTKVIIIGVAATLILFVGGVWFLSSQGVKEEKKLSKALIGEEIADQGANHIPEGSSASYLTNPPTGGPHYGKSAAAGIYDEPVPDGNLIHSMEHGAVILWYREATDSATTALSKQDIEKLKQIFGSVPVSKKIMVPRKSLDVPAALTSWGRLLKLQTIDENQIKSFMETNADRGPEKAPL